MKLLIIGASGGTGRCLVEQAVAQGHTVTVFKHVSRHFGRVKKTQYSVVEGDVLDYFSVEKAVTFKDAVLCALGHTSFGKTTLLSEGTKNILSAMQKLGVRRLVCESSLGVGDSKHQVGFFFGKIILPLFLKHAFADKAVQEKYIQQTDLNWVIVRAAALTNGKLTGKYRTVFASDTEFKAGKISRADVADFMLKQLTDTTYLHKTVGLSY